VENVPELPLGEGEWRVLPNKTLEYRLLPGELVRERQLQREEEEEEEEEEQLLQQEEQQPQQQQDNDNVDEKVAKPCEKVAKPRKSSIEVVVPGLKWLIRINGSTGVSLRSLTLAHTEWELALKVRDSWRDRAFVLPPHAVGRPNRIVGAGGGPGGMEKAAGRGAGGGGGWGAGEGAGGEVGGKSGVHSALAPSNVKAAPNARLASNATGTTPDRATPLNSDPVGGSGPLPVQSEMINAWKANRLQIDNCTVRNAGASGLYVAHSNEVLIARSIWWDFGAAAISTAVTEGALVTDCRIGRPGQVWQQGLGVEVGHSTNATVTRCELFQHPSDGVSFSGVGLVHNNTLSYSLLHDFGDAGVAGNRGSNETISDWGGVHTAHPNVTGLATHVHHNVFANFSSFAIGGYSLYFDYGSSGCNASQNLAYNTGSGIFFNSNGENGGQPGSWQALSDNIIAFDRAWNPYDSNTVIKWRTLAQSGYAHRNIFHVMSGTNRTSDLELFHDHSSTHPHQWDGMDWDRNLYFESGLGSNSSGNRSNSSGNTSTSTSSGASTSTRSHSHSRLPYTFGNTWPYFSNFSTWQARGKDVHSLITDPEFVSVGRADFRLRSSSPALVQLGFREWDHTGTGPACSSATGSAVGTVACTALVR
jgi:hypothetical protein